MSVKKYNTEEERKEAKRLAKKKYQEKNKFKIKEKQKKYRENNREKLNEKHKKYRENNREKEKERHREYRENNVNKEKKRHKKYYDNNPEYHKKYLKERKSNDPLFKLKENVRGIVYKAMMNGEYTKTSRTFEILGCSYEEFKLYIEKQFESWMSWDNYGNPKDHILEPNKTLDLDHKIPLNPKGIIRTEQEIIELNHYTNLQPLCSYTNRCVKRNIINHKNIRNNGKR